MFNFKRLKLLLSQFWQRSPRWYAFLPALTAVVLVTIAYYLLQFEGQQIQEGGRRFYSPFTVMMLFIWTNVIALTIISTHLVNRHLKDQRAQTEFYTLPVSQTERFTGLLLCVFLLIPLYGLCSSLISFFVLKVLAYPVTYPRWSWLDTTFFYALIPYYLIIIPYFTLSFLRPKMTIVWGIGLGVLCAAVIAMMANMDQSFMNTIWLDISSIKDQFTSDGGFYGPNLADREQITVNPFFEIMTTPFLMLIWLLPVVSLLFTSAWTALKKRQV